MLQRSQQVATNALIIANILIAGGAAFMVWMGTKWMIDGQSAMGLSLWNWVQMAMQRMVYGFVIGAIVGMSLFIVNKMIIRAFGITTTHIPQKTAVWTIAVISCAALAGSVQFVVTRPII